ncbi:hypothetical protein PAAG_12013 [Paracoccidioides lutzii Pb01]|uniref:Uncharacterized protein n=1 Tax=Paracoccidioides lutzii (strain ATCC MYA-826 / Pb01) TaxID=502779 RepID=A0A0A2V544_PARBA|nr:hypothetical protein PAAG_12013 [Paracoccidioides lutzii Pb01]KGQ01245.1 hypothetical protein PAAG_12013 [Paracoccidioides lutzii Pb01]
MGGLWRAVGGERKEVKGTGIGGDEWTSARGVAFVDRNRENNTWTSYGSTFLGDGVFRDNAEIGNTVNK